MTPGKGGKQRNETNNKKEIKKKNDNEERKKTCFVRMSNFYSLRKKNLRTLDDIEILRTLELDGRTFEIIIKSIRIISPLPFSILTLTPCE